MAVNYSLPLKTWLAAYPAGQVHVMQYEELVQSEEAEQAHLHRLKQFLGLNPALPHRLELPKLNMRKDRMGLEGWSMTRKEYQGLIDLVKPDAKE